MFLYAFLFVASLVVALVLFWIYNAVMDGGRAVNRAIHAGSKHHSVAELEQEIDYADVHGRPALWGQGDHASPAQAARTAAVATADSVPWGWPGNHQEAQEHGPSHVLEDVALVSPHSYSGNAPTRAKESTHGWPQREEKTEMAGTAYKVTRKTAASKATLRTSGRPWGW